MEESRSLSEVSVGERVVSITVELNEATIVRRKDGSAVVAFGTDKSSADNLIESMATSKCKFTIVDAPANLTINNDGLW